MDRERLIDGWLDAALRQHGEAEPRAGLENRVLANLRAEQQRLTERRWIWRPATTAVAAMLVIGAAVFLMRKPDSVPLVSVALHPPVPIVKSSGGVPPTVLRASGARSAAKAAAAPRLDQFPSPQPLSEQEKMLASYVREFPREAVLVARAQTELLKQDAIEQLEIERQNGIPKNSDEQP